MPGVPALLLPGLLPCPPHTAPTCILPGLQDPQLLASLPTGTGNRWLPSVAPPCPVPLLTTLGAAAPGAATPAPLPPLQLLLPLQQPLPPLPQLLRQRKGHGRDLRGAISAVCCLPMVEGVVNHSPDL